MEIKLGRKYVLSVTPNNSLEPIVIRPPITIEIDVLRNDNVSLKTATVRVFNLSKNHRDALLKDFYDQSPKLNGVNYSRTLTLQAGYASSKSLPVIFVGSLFYAFSRREGVNFVTELSCNCGAPQIPEVFYSGSPFKANTSYYAIINSLANLMVQNENGLKVGYISPDFQSISTKTTFSPKDTIWKELQVLTGGGLWLDNNIIYCMNNSNVLPLPITTIDSSMGLLETPLLENNNMILPIIFTPELTPGQQVNVQSRTIEANSSSLGKPFNGIHKIISVHHKGTISDAVCGDLRTEVGVQWGFKS